VQRVTPVVAPVAENALHVVELVRRRRSDDDLNGDGVANSPMQTPTG
jgi:hypothetical protein